MVSTWNIKWSTYKVYLRRHSEHLYGEVHGANLKKQGSVFTPDTKKTSTHLHRHIHKHGINPLSHLGHPEPGQALVIEDTPL